jgi:hypothetical protein
VRPLLFVILPQHSPLLPSPLCLHLVRSFPLLVLLSLLVVASLLSLTLLLSLNLNILDLSLRLLPALPLSFHIVPVSYNLLTFAMATPSLNIFTLNPTMLLPQFKIFLVL